MKPDALDVKFRGLNGSLGATKNSPGNKTHTKQKAGTPPVTRTKTSSGVTRQSPTVTVQVNHTHTPPVNPNPTPPYQPGHSLVTSNQGQVPSATGDKTLDNVINGLDGIDVKNVNIAELTSVMVKSIYALEAGLFAQAVQESKRMVSLRDMMTYIEGDLLSHGVYNNLQPHEKIHLLDVMSKSLKNSENFSLKLHSGITEGLHNVSNIGSYLPKDTKKPVSSKAEEIANRIKGALANKIKEKTV